MIRSLERHSRETTERPLEVPSLDTRMCLLHKIVETLRQIAEQKLGQEQACLSRFRSLPHRLEYRFNGFGILSGSKKSIRCGQELNSTSQEEEAFPSRQHGRSCMSRERSVLQATVLRKRRTVQVDCREDNIRVDSILGPRGPGIDDCIRFTRVHVLT
jgi:hypothetical protein